MKRGRLLQRAVGIVVVVWFLFGCAPRQQGNVDPALAGFSQENMTLTSGCSDFHPSQVIENETRVERVGGTARITVLRTQTICNGWYDAGYKLDGSEFTVKIISGSFVGPTRDGQFIEEIVKCLCNAHVDIEIANLPEWAPEPVVTMASAAERRVDERLVPR